MVLYVMVVNDRQIGVRVSLFANLCNALVAARDMAQGLCRDPEAYHQYPAKRAGELFFARYASTEEFVRVEEREVDAEV